MGYGSHQKVHRKKLFSISDDRPVTVSVIDEEAKIRPAIPESRSMLKEGLFVLLDVERA